MDFHPFLAQTSLDAPTNPPGRQMADLALKLAGNP
jgi:hypothetical protein